ncbi:hypothetical protein D0Y65_004295 [Glycine soja]|uniref:Uncharacterized protein n=1 Tax=Glycine soja TaxID=3848 RepID=A0A445LQT1_GLYSO|nr:hypothetical protein D0Y65_004295 [Glycine soja]
MLSLCSKTFAIGRVSMIMKVLQGKVGKDPVYGILSLINTQEPNQPMVFKQKKMSVEQIICSRYTASFYRLLKTIKVLQGGIKDVRSHYQSQIKSKLWHWNHH